MACHIICFVSFRLVSFRFVLFRFDLFRFVSICFVSFRFVSFRSVSFRTLQGPVCDALARIRNWLNRAEKANLVKDLTHLLLVKFRLNPFNGFGEVENVKFYTLDGWTKPTVVQYFRQVLLARQKFPWPSSRASKFSWRLHHVKVSNGFIYRPCHSSIQKLRLQDDKL